MKEVSRINRRSFIKGTAAFLGGLGLSACANSLPISEVAEGLGKAAAAEGGRHLTEKTLEGILQRQYQKKTEIINKNNELIVPIGSDWRFSLKFGEGDRGFGGFDFNPAILTAIIRSRLEQSLGAKSVASMPQVVEETGERAMLRSNEEIDPETISPKKTIKREGGGLAVTFHIDSLGSDGRFGLTSEGLSELRDFFTSQGLDFHLEWITQAYVITLEVWDKDSQTTERGGALVGYGGAVQIRDIDFDVFSARGRTRLRRSVAEDPEKKYAALNNALSNLIGQIKLKKQISVK